MEARRINWFKMVTASLLVVCGSANSAPPTFSITADIKGLSASGLVLQNNGGGSVTVAPGATQAIIATGVNSGSTYSVTVHTDPAGQSCSVANGNGTVSANVSKVSINCVTKPGPGYSVGGSITGLTGEGLSLRLNDSAGTPFNVSPAAGAASFAFAALLTTGLTYTVTVQAQPSNPQQRCVIANGQNGTIGTANVSNLVVDCSGGAGGAVQGSGPLLDPQQELGWYIFVVAFNVRVNISDLSWSDGYCTMGGLMVDSTFTESPESIGTPAGGIDWKDGKGSVSIEFYIDSFGAITGQLGQSAPGFPLSCSRESKHFTQGTYRMSGNFSSLTGTVSLPSAMPVDNYTSGNIGCPGEQGDSVGGQCHVAYFLDNPGLNITVLDLDQLFTVGTVTVPIRGSGINTQNSGVSRSGNYTWNGTVTLRIVPPPPVPSIR